MKLPAVGRVELSIIEEELPELLAFEKGDFDYALLGGSASKRLLQDGKLKPEYSARGIRHVRYPVPALHLHLLQSRRSRRRWQRAEKIALRRAIGLGFNTPEFVRVVQGGDGIPATQLLPPGVDGYDAAAAKRASYDPAAARALLDRFGYVDRDGDGFRELPDGSPLTLTQNGTARHAVARNRQAVDHEHEGHRTPDEDQQRAVRRAPEAGEGRPAPGVRPGLSLAQPSGFAILPRCGARRRPTRTTRASGTPTTTRLRAVPAHAAGTGAERGRAPDVRRRGRLRADRLRAYPVGNAFMQPWVKGYYPSNFAFNWKYVDIDLDKKRAAR